MGILSPQAARGKQANGRAAVMNTQLLKDPIQGGTGFPSSRGITASLPCDDGLPADTGVFYPVIPAGSGRLEVARTGRQECLPYTCWQCLRQGRRSWGDAITLRTKAAPR
jgi:hypothetical protein